MWYNDTPRIERTPHRKFNFNFDRSGDLTAPEAKHDKAGFWPSFFVFSGSNQ